MYSSETAKLAPAQALPWFCDRLGYTYDAVQHGAFSDWLIDLVSTSSSSKDAGSGAMQHHMSQKVRLRLRAGPPGTLDNTLPPG